jgi:hypothetical protein
MFTGVWHFLQPRLEMSLARRRVWTTSGTDRGEGPPAATRLTGGDEAGSVPAARPAPEPTTAPEAATPAAEVKRPARKRPRPPPGASPGAGAGVPVPPPGEIRRSGRRSQRDVLVARGHRRRGRRRENGAAGGPAPLVPRSLLLRATPLVSAERYPAGPGPHRCALAAGAAGPMGHRDQRPGRPGGRRGQPELHADRRDAGSARRGAARPGPRSLASLSYCQAGLPTSSPQVSGAQESAPH